MMSEWISVEDRWPEIGERVLVYQERGVHGGHTIDIDYRTCEEYPDNPELNNRIVWKDQGIHNDIHWWMPLPEPPKVKDE